MYPRAVISSTYTSIHILIHITDLKGVGNKRRNAWNITFLRYLTDGLGMISGLFSRRPFIKIFISHLTISISRFRITTYFSEIFAKFPEFFFKILFWKSYFHIYITYPPPTSHTHTQHPKPWTHPELQIHFSRNVIFSAFSRLFPTPFITRMNMRKYVNTGIYT